MNSTDIDLWIRSTADVLPLDKSNGTRRKGTMEYTARAKPLRHGQMRVSAQLDLHGLTLAEAHTTLMDFITTTPARNVVIITGASGILKTQVPLWLESVPRVISAYTASPKYGGEGALYLRLRGL